MDNIRFKIPPGTKDTGRFLQSGQVDLITIEKSALEAGEGKRGERGRERQRKRFDRSMYFPWSHDTLSHYIVMLSEGQRKWNALKQ